MEVKGEEIVLNTAECIEVKDAAFMTAVVGGRGVCMIECGKALFIQHNGFHAHCGADLLRHGARLGHVRVGQQRQANLPNCDQEHQDDAMGPVKVHGRHFIAD